MRKAALGASLAVLGMVALPLAPAAHATDSLAECSGWNAATLTRYAHTADLAFNRDRRGEPILYGLTQAVWLMQRGRWGDAAYSLIGFDRPFWLIPGHGGKRVPGVVGRISAVLHHCGVRLGPDYSMRPIPSRTRQPFQRWG